MLYYKDTLALHESAANRRANNSDRKKMNAVTSTINNQVVITGLESPVGYGGRLLIELPQRADPTKVLDILAVDGVLSYAATGNVLAIHHCGPTNMLSMVEQCLRVIASALQLKTFGRFVRVNDGSDRIARTIKVSVDNTSVVLRIFTHHVYESQLHILLTNPKTVSKYTGNIATRYLNTTSTVSAR